MPNNDIASTAKHIRLGHFDKRPWLVEALTGFPGLKGVVSHQSGTKSEHPHLHIFWEDEVAVTSATIKNRLRAHDPRFAELKGNGDWRLKPHDSWNNWATYVTGNLSHKVEIPFGDLEARSHSILSVMTPAPSVSLNPSEVLVKPKKRPMMKDRLVDYCIDVLGWELEVTNPTATQVYEACCKCFSFNYNDGQGIAVMRYCLWEFSDEDSRQHMMASQRHKFINSLM